MSEMVEALRKAREVIAYQRADMAGHATIPEIEQEFGSAYASEIVDMDEALAMIDTALKESP